MGWDGGCAYAYFYAYELTTRKEMAPWGRWFTVKEKKERKKENSGGNKVKVESCVFDLKFSVDSGKEGRRIELKKGVSELVSD